MSAEPVLIVDDDPFVLGLLTHVGESRGMTVVGVSSSEEADAAMTRRPFAVAVIDLQLQGQSGLETLRRLRAYDPSLQAIVISADRRQSSALESFEHDIFAFLPKPLDPAHTFATIERAILRRREAKERRRLTSELELLYTVAGIVSSSLELDSVLQQALEHVTPAFGARYGAIRLVPASGGEPRVRATVGVAPADMQAVYSSALGPLPSDYAFQRRMPVRVNRDNKHEFSSRLPTTVEWSASIAVPIMAGDEVLGALSLVSQERDGFTEEDEHLLLTIARQFGSAVSKALLYERVHRAKVEWERTFDAISDPIGVFGRDRRAMRANAAVAALGGWRITDTPQHTCDETGLCGGGPGCLVSRALEDGASHTREALTADGRIFTVTALPMPGADAALLFGKEVTEERTQARQLRNLSAELTTANQELRVTVDRLHTTQAQLVQSEKLSAIGQLVAGVAHELNNPLTSIIGYAQLVQEAIQERPEWVQAAAGIFEDIERVVSESERAARIVRNLLTFARRQSSERTRTDMGDLCRRVLALRQYAHQVRELPVDCEFPPDVPPVYVDDSQIQQALLNLVLNAEQAMKDAPNARLALTLVPEPESSSLLLSIADTGHGIADEDLPRVFDPFFTTRAVGEGTGLGLSIVYGIVRDHGGQVWVDSSPEGTTFFVRLPARFCEPSVDKMRAVVGHADSVSRDFFVAVLTGWGFEARPASNLRECVERVEAGDAGLVLVDASVVEPDVPRWRAACRQQGGAVRLVALDGPGIGPDAARFLRDSALFVLKPPFDLPNIRRAVLAAQRPTI